MNPLRLWTDSEALARRERRFVAAGWEATGHRIGASG